MRRQQSTLRASAHSRGHRLGCLGSVQGLRPGIHFPVPAAAFGQSEPGLLPPQERRLDGNRHRAAIGTKYPGRAVTHDVLHDVWPPGIHGRHEAVPESVRHDNRFVDIAGRLDHRHRPEALFLDDGRALGRIPDQRRQEPGPMLVGAGNRTAAQKISEALGKCHMSQCAPVRNDRLWPKKCDLCEFRSDCNKSARKSPSRQRRLLIQPLREATPIPATISANARP